MAKDEGKKTTGSRGRTVTPPPKRNYTWLIVGIVVVAVAAGIGYFAFRASATPPGLALPDVGHSHIQIETEAHAPYNSDPPTSGPHLPYIAPWGIHTEPITKELQVHNLEDGGVMVQYNCPSGCPDLVAKLKAIVARYPEHVILAPYPGMKTRIALTAWTRIDAFDDYDESRIVRFINAYQGVDHHTGVE
jgi:uncharacterized protein DUF3105